MEIGKKLFPDIVLNEGDRKWEDCGISSLEAEE